MMEEKKIEKNEKLLNPIPFIGIAIVLIFLAIVYYTTRPAKTEDLPRPTETSEPITLHIDEDRYNERTTVTVGEIESILKPAAELITSKYYYTNATDFESVLTWFGSGVKNPFTTSKGYIVYDGVVSAGIDMSDVRYNINTEENIITITLPEVKVLAHEIDDSSVMSNSKESIFNILDAEYYAKLIDGCKKSTEEKVMGNKDFVKQIEDNTKKVFTDFLSFSEITREYTVEFEGHS